MIGSVISQDGKPPFLTFVLAHLFLISFSSLRLRLSGGQLHAAQPLANHQGDSPHRRPGRLHAGTLCVLLNQLHAGIHIGDSPRTLRVLFNQLHIGDSPRPVRVLFNQLHAGRRPAMPCYAILAE